MLVCKKSVRLHSFLEDLDAAWTRTLRHAIPAALQGSDTRPSLETHEDGSDEERLACADADANPSPDLHDDWSDRRQTGDLLEADFQEGDDSSDRKSASQSFEGGSKGVHREGDRIVTDILVETRDALEARDPERLG